jgi:RimJ/RimL family protein N-acetyltransferase
MIRLRGPRVTLRSLTEADLPALYTATHGEKDPAWKQFDAPYFPLQPQTWEGFVQEWTKQVGSPNRLVIEVEGRLIGTVSYYWEHKETRWLEAGLAIYDSTHWNGGYGTEALRLWVDHLFATLEIARVGITTWSGNPRMMRLAEKLGFQLEGRMRRCRYWNGVYYDSIRMGVLREEWAERKR